MGKSEKRRFGDIGEEIACRFLKNRGFTVLEQNYLKKWGEIDIVAQKDGAIHFVEVKTSVFDASRKASRDYRPEENVHAAKLARLRRAVETWLLDNHIPPDTDYRVNVVAVRLDLAAKKALVESIENVL